MKQKNNNNNNKIPFFFFFLFWFNLWSIFWLLIFNDNFLIYICHVFILWWWDSICFYHCRNASLPSSPALWLRNLEEGVKLWTWMVLWADLFVLQTWAPKLTTASLAERATQRNYKQNFLSFFLYCSERHTFLPKLLLQETVFRNNFLFSNVNVGKKLSISSQNIVMYLGLA